MDYVKNGVIYRDKERPKATTPLDAHFLFEHKRAKLYPFNDIRGYDYEALTDFRAYGKMLREDNKPVIQNYTDEYSEFYLHSQQSFLGVPTYIFCHVLLYPGNTKVRGLMFDNFSDAMRYAIAHGCRIVKKRSIPMSVVDYMESDSTDDLDMFIDRIDPFGGSRMRQASRIQIVKG